MKHPSEKKEKNNLWWENINLALMLTRKSLPLRSRVFRAPNLGNESNALTLSSKAALGPALCR